VKQHAHVQHYTIQCCNNTHQWAPRTGKQTMHTRIERTAVLASTVPYCIMYLQKICTWKKNVTDNRQLMSKLNESLQKCAAHATPARSLRFGPRWR